MIVTLSFSAVAYSSFIAQTRRAFEMHERRLQERLEIPNPLLPPPRIVIDEEAIKEMKTNTLINIALINIFVLVAAGVPGYWLAGKTLKPIEEMVERQKKFITDAAHELKTPLTAMKTNMEVNLRNKKLDLGKAKETLNSTVKDVDSITVLVNSLLKQSRYQNYSDGKKEKVDLKELINSILEKMGGRLEDKNIVSSIKGENFEIEVNKESIYELFTILIDNAIKFNKQGGSIEVSISKNDKYSFVEIKDTGTGIDEKDITHVFDRFYKADASRSRTQNDGFGLGLSIAREIVDLSKGEITVKSDKGKGTSFAVKLPLR